MKKSIIWLGTLCFLLALVLPSLLFYRGIYWVTPPPRPRFEDITLSMPLSTPVAERFIETTQRTGTLLIDAAHQNQYNSSELAVLLEKVLANGYAVRYFESKETEKPEDLIARLEEKLRLVDSLVVICPWEAFTAGEMKLIRDFVNKGGKLLLIADPTRRSEINSLANQFGMSFNDDYLYNIKENDGNFRNVFIYRFKESNLTEGLKRIAFYSAASIGPSLRGLGFTDENTFSNLSGASEVLSPISITEDEKVLALGDFTFMMKSYNTIYDNNRLISNVADWLTLSLRKFLFADFPYFFKDEVSIELGDGKLIELGAKVKNLLEKEGIASSVRAGAETDRVFIGLFSKIKPVETQLKAGGISIGVDKPTTITVEGIGEIPKEGSAIMYLYQEKKQSVLIILGDDDKAVDFAIESLKTGEFRGQLVKVDLAISRLEAKPK